MYVDFIMVEKHMSTMWRLSKSGHVTLFAQVPEQDLIMCQSVAMYYL